MLHLSSMLHPRVSPRLSRMLLHRVVVEAGSTMPAAASAAAGAPLLLLPNSSGTHAATLPSFTPARYMSVSPKKRALRAAARAAQAGGRLPGQTHGLYGHFTVALVGRPNVGKSRLFNRLIGQKLAIVNPIPGTTRDWKEAKGNIAGMEFTAMDTGGLEDGATRDAIEAKMKDHTARAIQHADAVLFVVDYRNGVTEEDLKFVRWLKRLRPTGSIHLVANKAEQWFSDAGAGVSSADDEDELPAAFREFYRLGLGDPVPVSAEMGLGFPDLYNTLEPYALRNGAAEAAIAGETALVADIPADDAAAFDPDVPAEDEAKPFIRMAIVGRPNVGKSTLVNQLVGEQRVLAGPTPGLTRDTTTVELHHREATIQLSDTAGMRRWGAWDLSTPLEGEAVGAAKQALQRANVVTLVVDASGGAAAGLTHLSPQFRDVMPSASELEAAGMAARSKLRAAAHASPLSSAAWPSASASASSSAAAAAATAALAPLTAAERVTGVSLTRQDLSIAQQVIEEGRGLVIVLNKVDTLVDKSALVSHVRDQLASMHQLQDIELVPVSALRGAGMGNLLPAVLRTYRRWNFRISTGQLNKWLELITRHHPPPSVTVTVGRHRGSDGDAQTRRMPLRIKYLTQISSRPPTFAMFVNRNAVPESYQRFIVNALRKEFELYGVPIRMHVRAPENPFKARSRSATPSTTSLTKHFKASDAVKSAEKARARKLAFARMARQSAARRAQEAEAAAGAGEERAKPPPFNPARAPPSALRRASKNLRASGGAIKHINSKRLKRARGQASARNE